MIDPDNNRTDYQYDSMNRLILTRDALGHDTQITYDAFGNVLTLTDAAGNVTTNTYDSFNRLMQRLHRPRRPRSAGGPGDQLPLRLRRQPGQDDRPARARDDVRL